MNAWFLLHKEQTKCHRNHLAKINIPSRSMISSCSPIVITGTDSAQVPRWPLHMCTSLESHSHVNGVIAFPRLGRRIHWTPDMEIVNAVVTACGRDTWMNICLMHCAWTVRGHSTDGCIGRLISDAWWSLLTDSKKEHLCFSFFSSRQFGSNSGAHIRLFECRTPWSGGLLLVSAADPVFVIISSPGQLWEWEKRFLWYRQFIYKSLWSISCTSASVKLTNTVY